MSEHGSPGSENPGDGGSGADERGGSDPGDGPGWVDRRRLLRVGGALGALSLSGCSGLFGASEPGTDTPPEPATETARTTGGGVDHSGTATRTANVDGERVERVLGGLSLDEKIGQMSQLEPKARGRVYSTDRARDEIESLRVGSILFGGANAPGTTAAEAARFFNEAQSAAVDALGVPLLIGIDAVHGNATVAEAAVFPHQIGIGATWDTDLAGSLARATGRSLAAMGVNWTFSPVADVAYDPRWGRYYECFCEDPHVAGAFVAAMVRGYERVADGDKRVAATVKHFAGYSLPETGDDREPADVSRRTLEDVVLPPYRAGVDAGAETVMANSGSVNGIPAHASEWLQTTVLRDRWGFDGLVVSDWGDIYNLVSAHGYASDFREAVAMAVDAGVDVYMAPHPDQIRPYQSALRAHVDAGRIDESRIDEAVRRILRVKDRLGLFDDPTVPVERHRAVATDRDRALARRAAAESLTLLANGGDLLPLGSDVDSVLVAGPNADSPVRQLGGWTTAWQGAPNADAAPETVTLARGIAAAAPSGVDVSVVETDPATLANRSQVERAAAEADVTVTAIGEGAYAEGRGDVDALRLPGGQRDLVAALGATDAPSVGVLVAGRPRGSPGLFADLDAALMAYYPGSEGGRAVGDALFGASPPAGRLPFTWPRTVGAVPDAISHRSPPHDGGAVGASAGNGDANGADPGPLFPFGHGGSYVPVSHERLSLSASSVRDGTADVTARVAVRNDGDVETDEVVVLFADYDHEAGGESPAIPAARQVVGFDRISVAAGETATATVPLALDALAVTSGGLTAEGERVVPAGTYRLDSPGASATLRIEETAPLDG